MSPDELREQVAEFRRFRGPAAPLLMIAAVAQDPRLSFAHMGDCMAVGIAGGCGLLCPVLHAGRCETEDDFREDALQVLAALQSGEG